MPDPVAPAADSKTSTPEQSFLARLTEFGDQIIAAERPTFEQLPRVVGALIHWIDQGGAYTAPEFFNPELSQAVADQEAEQSRLAADNAALGQRLASLETLMRQQIAGAAVPAPGAVSESTPGEGAAPVAPAAASTDVVPGVVEAPPEAEAPKSPVEPVPPASE